MLAPAPPSRTLRAGAYLAIVFGIVGAISGLAGAGTFIPYQHDSTFRSQLAPALTVIAAAGAVVSCLGVVAGWGLLRTKDWAWNTTVGVAAACVGLLAVMTALWPGSWGFLLVVFLAYGFEVALLLAARPGPRFRPAAPATG